jgi:hypothetical protein
MNSQRQSMFTRDPITGAMGIIAATGDIDGSPLRFQRMFYKARRSIGRRLADVRSCLLVADFVAKVGEEQLSEQ